MRKLFYILAFAFAASLTVTSCTEEEIGPTETTGGAGGGVIDPKG